MGKEKAYSALEIMKQRDKLNEIYENIRSLSEKCGCNGVFETPVQSHKLDKWAQELFTTIAMFNTWLDER